MRAYVRRLLRGGGTGAAITAMAIAAMAVALMAPVAGANTPAVLEYVSAKPLPVEFTGASGAVTVEDEGGTGALHCVASSSKGEIVGPRQAILESVYTECSTEAEGKTFACQSSGASAGEIKTGALETELVYIDKAEEKIGMVLNPKGGKYVAYECGGIPAEGRGSIISSITPVNQATTSFTQVFSQSHGAQVPAEYETANGEKHKAIAEGSVEGFSVGTTGTEATNTTKTVEPLEIKVEPEKQSEEKHEESSNVKKQEEEAAATKKRQEEETAKKRAEEEAAKKSATGSISLDGATLAVKSSGAVSIKLTCTGTSTCEGKLTLTAKGKARKGKKAKAKTIGTGSFTVASGHTATVTLTLTGAGRALLKAGHGSLSASLAILKSSPAPSQKQNAAVRLVQKRAAKPKKKK
jgi:hypothetical protein